MSDRDKHKPPPFFTSKDPADVRGQQNDSFDVQAALRQVQLGNAEAIGLLYDHFSGFVFSIALRVVGNTARAEDVLQEVFLHIWRCPDAYLEAHANLAAWLAIVTRNKAVDMLRNRRPAEFLEDSEVAVSGALPLQLEQREMFERAVNAVERLPPEQREILELAFFQGMTPSAIQVLTGIPLATIKTEIRLALMTIRNGLNGVSET